jgi:hypothetical protein
MPNAGLIEDEPELNFDLRGQEMELYSILARYLRPRTISKVLNDIEADVDMQAISFNHVIEIMQRYHTHVLAQKAEADDRD